MLLAKTVLLEPVWQICGEGFNVKVEVGTRS